MELHCDSGDLAGRTLERSNGSSWWDVADRTVYTTKSIVSTDGQDVVHHHEYGNKSGTPETCTGQHFEWTWDLTVVEAGA